MPERAFLVAYENNFRGDDDLELRLRMASEFGAGVMGAAGYGLLPGCRADLFLMDAVTTQEAVVDHPVRKLVMKA